MRVVVWWLLDPARWSHAFHGLYALPLIGLIALPWTTLAWVLVAPHGTAGGPGRLLVIIAFLLDLGSWSGGGFGNRRHLTRGSAAAP